MSGETDETNGKSAQSSSTWFGSLKESLQEQMDEQRLGRLQQCRALDEILAECRRHKRKMKKNNNNHNNGKKDGGDDDTNNTSRDRRHLEDVPAGIRMVKYFQWRDVDEYDSRCQREEHSVWACRAVSLQCGAELVAVRDCFDGAQAIPGADGYSFAQQEQPPPRNYGAVLGSVANSRGYTMTKEDAVASDADGTVTAPCMRVQQRLGECVARNSKALLERKNARKEKAAAAAAVQEKSVVVERT
jgi:hypothetical protein